jgi:hypothetical protein
MAGPQSRSLSSNTNTMELYKVPNHNTPPSGVYFNKVKAWMKHNMSKEVLKWEEVFGEKKFWNIVYDEMTQYTFGFEANQATHIYLKYKDKLT